MAFSSHLLRAGTVVATASVVVVCTLFLISSHVRWGGDASVQREQGWIELVNDFSTADRSLDWNLDAPSKADGSAKSWYAAGTGGGGGSLASIMAADGMSTDGDAPQASDGSSSSWASAGTYDPAGLAQGGEAAQLKQLKETLEAHGAY